MDENILNGRTPDESIYSKIDAERQQIDNTINGVAGDENSEVIGLREEVEKLQAKLADESNYFVVATEDEKLEMELVEEEIAEIHRLQEILPKNVTACDEEMEVLNKEIADISTRLRKNQIAVQKNYFSQLSAEDVKDLQESLEAKTNQLSETLARKSRIQQRSVELDNRLTGLLKTQEKLSKILTGHKVDKYKKLLDKNRYYSLKAGLDALENRKNYIEQNKAEVYNEYVIKEQNDEIAALKARLAQLEAGKAVDEKQNNVQENNDLNNAIPLPASSIEKEPEAKEEESIDRGETGMIVAPPTGMSVVEPVGPAPDPFIDIYSHSGDIDLEREAEIEDAKDILKEKKKEGWFKKHWKKFVAAGMIVLAPFLIKGCVDMREAPKYVSDDTNNKDSYSSTDEGITEQNQAAVDEKFEIPSEQNTTSTPNTVVNEQKPTENKQEEVKPSTTTPSPETPSPEQTPVTPEPEPTPTPDPVPDPIPDTTPEQTVETGKIELNPNEKIIGLDSSGNLTTLEHGDAVGTEAELEGPNESINVKLEDYNQDGTAEVTYEKTTTNTDSTSSTKTEQQQIIDNILGTYGEENNIGMFDPDQFDENGNWIGDLSSNTMRRGGK